MAHKLKPQYIRHIDIVNESHETTVDSGIDPLAPGAPRSPAKIDGINLELYEHQRLVLAPMISLENAAYAKCFLPPIKAQGDGINSLFRDSRRLGAIETNAWFMHLPVGSGKTLIILSLVAESRVPSRRNTIISCDFAHAYVNSIQSEMDEFPRKDAGKLSLIGDNPWYFSDTGPAFPSLRPKIVDRVTVNDDDILPSTVFMVNQSLLGQMRGYCETQVKYPWIILEDLKAISDFLVLSCIDPAETFGKYHLIILPARTYLRSDTISFELASKSRALDLTKKGENMGAVGKIQKMIRIILNQQRAIPTSDFFTAYCGAHNTTKVLARFVVDDYDTLHLQSASRPPALSYIFVSGTSISYPGNQFGFPSKPSYQTYARRAITIAVEPSKVLAFIGLAPPDEQSVLCVESVIQKMFVHLCTVVTYYIKCYAAMAKQRFAIDAITDPLDVVLEKIQEAINNDSIVSVFGQLMLLHQAGSKVGFPLFPEKVVVVKDPRQFTLGEIGSMLYSKIYSERTRVNLALISLECLERVLREQQFPTDMRYVIATIRNFVNLTSYPSCCIPFREVSCIALEPRFAMSQITMAKLPDQKGTDDFISEVWKFIQPKPNVMQLFNYLEFVTPYIIYAIWAGKNFGNISVSGAECIKAISSARENLLGIQTAVENMAQPFDAMCVTCNKAAQNAILLTCCGSICCYGCLQRTIHSPATCSICGNKFEDSDRIGLPLSTEVAKSMNEIASTLQAIQAARQEKDAFERYPKTNLFYLPLCPSILKFESKVSHPSKPECNTVILDKIQTLKISVSKLKKQTPVRILLYHNYADVNATIVEAMKSINVKTCPFDSKDGQLYRTSPEHLLIIANDLSQICGFNMEYLDAVIFYSPPKHTDEKKQIVCRGQRLGRNVNHKLIILTFFYPRELANAEYHIPTVNDLMLWKKIDPEDRIDEAVDEKVVEEDNVITKSEDVKKKVIEEDNVITKSEDVDEKVIEEDNVIAKSEDVDEKVVEEDNVIAKSEEDKAMQKKDFIEDEDISSSHEASTSQIKPPEMSPNKFQRKTRPRKR